MNSANRLWILATAVISIAVLALGGLLGVAPQLAAITAADAERTSVEAQNQATRAEIAALKKQSEQIDDLKDQLKDLNVAIPSDAALEKWSSEVAALATKAGVTVSNYTVAAAVNYSPPTIEAGAALTRNADISADPTAGGLVTPENFVAIEVGIEVEEAVTLGRTLLFFALLQSSDRLFTITDITMTADDGVGTTLITGLIFVLIDPNAPAVPVEGEEEEEEEPEPTETPTPDPTQTPGATETPAPGDTQTPAP